MSITMHSSSTSFSLAFLGSYGSSDNSFGNSYSCSMYCTSPDAAPSFLASTSPVDATHSCAFPSWPRRDSLSDLDNSPCLRASSFFSDDELLDLPPCVDLASPVFDESDARSFSSAGSHRRLDETVAIIQAQREQVEREEKERRRNPAAHTNCHRDIMRFLAEKERRRQQHQMREAAFRHQHQSQSQHQRVSPSSSRKRKASPKAKLAGPTSVLMTPIAEAD